MEWFIIVVGEEGSKNISYGQKQAKIDILNPQREKEDQKGRNRTRSLKQRGGFESARKVQRAGNNFGARCLWPGICS